MHEGVLTPPFFKEFRGGAGIPDSSYRVSHNIVSTFLLLISRPPKHLEVPSWTFFNSPFRVDFKTIQFVIIW